MSDMTPDMHKAEEEMYTSLLRTLDKVKSDGNSGSAQNSPQSAQQRDRGVLLFGGLGNYEAEAASTPNSNAPSNAAPGTPFSPNRQDSTPQAADIPAVREKPSAINFNFDAANAHTSPLDSATNGVFGSGSQTQHTPTSVTSGNGSAHSQHEGRSAVPPEWLLNYFGSSSGGAVAHKQPKDTMLSDGAIQIIEQLKQRIVALETENNDLKKQLRLRTPPPNEAQQMHPSQHLLAQRAAAAGAQGRPGNSPSTPTQNGLPLLHAAFLPISSPSPNQAGHQGQFANTILPSPVTTPTPGMQGGPLNTISPTINPQTPISSPGPKASVNNVCRHWLVNRCTYGNDCRFGHPSSDATHHAHQHHHQHQQHHPMQAQQKPPMRQDSKDNLGQASPSLANCPRPVIHPVLRESEMFLDEMAFRQAQNLQMGYPTPTTA